MCLDANADLLDKEFQDLIRKTELIDLMATRLGADLPETYVRGKKTIDHIFGSPRVEGAIEGAGYLAFNDGIMSDHRGIFIDFNRGILFGKDQVTAERPQRMLSTKNKKGAAQYRTTASQSIISNNILKRAKEIEAQAKIGFTTKVQEDLEVLDTELHNLLLKAEQQIEPLPIFKFLSVAVFNRSINYIHLNALIITNRWSAISPLVAVAYKLAGRY